MAGNLSSLLTDWRSVVDIWKLLMPLTSKYNRANGLAVCVETDSYRPLSRRLDRCDRVIQDETGDSNGGNTSQCDLRSLRVNSGMLNVIRIVTYYALPPLESPDSFWIAMAFSR